MDARSEQTFVSRFQQAKFDSTLILITHRTSLLSFVDRVIIMEYGKIAGMGTTEQFQRAQTDRKAAAEIVKNAVSAQAGRSAPSSESRPAEGTRSEKDNAG
jgi:ABC-type bacteriocin/lantibiotic exporter with double-glycine peptidase domain